MPVRLCIPYDLEKVTDMKRYPDFGVMFTPAARRACMRQDGLPIRVP